MSIYKWSHFSAHQHWSECILSQSKLLHWLSICGFLCAHDGNDSITHISMSHDIDNDPITINKIASHFLVPFSTAPHFIAIASARETSAQTCIHVHAHNGVFTRGSWFIAVAKTNLHMKLTSRNLVEFTMVTCMSVLFVRQLHQRTSTNGYFISDNVIIENKTNTKWKTIPLKTLKHSL